jgi:rRNA maturation protein Nop10
MNTIQWERDNGEGENEVIEVPATWQVCGTCGGEGRTLSPAFRGQLDSDLMMDDEFMEEYMKGGEGIYGCSCPECGGRTTVLAPDTSTPLGKAYAKWAREEEWERAKERRIRMIECGDVEGYLAGGW